MVRRTSTKCAKNWPEVLADNVLGVYVHFCEMKTYKIYTT